jgi:hypothetical protein
MSLPKLKLLDPCSHYRYQGDSYGCAVLESCSPATAGEPMPACPSFHRAGMPVTKQEPPCVHLGQPILRDDGLRETALCIPCSVNAGSRINVEVLACTVHGRCTQTKAATGIACCVGCKEKKTINAIQVIVDADGIGDAILGLTSAAGLKRDDPTRHVSYCCSGLKRKGAAWQLPWVKLFEGYDSLATVPSENIPSVYPHGTYAAQNAERLTSPRWEHYARSCKTKAVLPWPRLLPADAIQWAESFRGAVVLAPFSGWMNNQPSSGYLPNNRVWLPANWLHLERLLAERGRQVIILDGCTEHRERTHAYRSVVLRDEPPERVAAVLAMASAFVGNDSGITHLAGALRVPSIVLCGAVLGEKIFGIYPTVQAINGPLPCSGCHWQGAHGYHSQCNTICASLQMIEPAKVFDAVEKIAGKPLGILSDPAADRCIGAILDKLRDPVPDRRATLNAFMRAIVAKSSPVVIETGCMRGDDDYGAGMSTVLFGRLLASHGGNLTSVDNSQEHVDFARSRTHDLPVTVALFDSRPWLRNYAGPKINALYLDSQDTWEKGFQECCLEEAKEAAPHMADDSVILIDDTWPMGGGKLGGKGSQAVPWLVANGWRVELTGYQILFRREAKRNV